jgi:hypothetical protein
MLRRPGTDAANASNASCLATRHMCTTVERSTFHPLGRLPLRRLPGQHLQVQLTSRVQPPRSQVRQRTARRRSGSTQADQAPSRRGGNPEVHRCPPPDPWRCPYVFPNTSIRCLWQRWSATRAVDWSRWPGFWGMSSSNPTGTGTRSLRAQLEVPDLHFGRGPFRPSPGGLPIERYRRIIVGSGSCAAG